MKVILATGFLLILCALSQAQEFNSTQNLEQTYQLDLSEPDHAPKHVYSKQNLQNASMDDLNIYLKKAKKLRKNGLIIYIAGSISFYAGGALFLASDYGYEGFFLLAGGFVTAAVGIPIFVTNAIRVSNIKKAITSRTGANISMAPSFVFDKNAQNLNTGLTLRIRF
jgi:hypothetical protein